ncbi:MAG: hypothetical protein ABF468_10810, partial [Acetobacter fabarum]|uniref:hypothetical protein n=1 Tax=Acetobacter fabarum TaxID=483199 RepID=UPI0039EB20D2
VQVLIEMQTDFRVFACCIKRGALERERRGLSRGRPTARREIQSRKGNKAQGRKQEASRQYLEP